MALARYGTLVNAISGSIGTVTFKAGNSAGVLTRRARLNTGKSAAQRRGQEVWAKHMAEWTKFTATQRRTWDEIARSFQVPNRLGVMRRWSGRAAFMNYVTLVDPMGESPDSAYPPPIGGVCAPYKLDVIWFGAPGISYAIWQQPWDESTVQYLWIKRMMNFGERDSGGRRAFIAAVANTSQGTNWQPYIEARGLYMVQGEMLRCEFRFAVTGSQWPSPPVVLDITWGVEYQPG